MPTPKTMVRRVRARPQRAQSPTLRSRRYCSFSAADHSRARSRSCWSPRPDEGARACGRGWAPGRCWAGRCGRCDGGCGCGGRCCECCCGRCGGRCGGLCGGCCCECCCGRGEGCCGRAEGCCGRGEGCCGEGCCGRGCARCCGWPGCVLGRRSAAGAGADASTAGAYTSDVDACASGDGACGSDGAAARSSSRSSAADASGCGMGSAETYCTPRNSWRWRSSVAKSRASACGLSDLASCVTRPSRGAHRVARGSSARARASPPEVPRA